MEFDTRLDLAPYMSDRRGSAQPYELFGVLVHAGHSVHSGHYYCFARAANGLWHQFDDHQVKQVGALLLQQCLFTVAHKCASILIEQWQFIGACADYAHAPVRSLLR